MAKSWRAPLWDESDHNKQCRCGRNEWLQQRWYDGTGGFFIDYRCRGCSRAETVCVWAD